MKVFNSRSRSSISNSLQPSAMMHIRYELSESGPICRSIIVQTRLIIQSTKGTENKVNVMVINIANGSFPVVVDVCCEFGERGSICSKRYGADKAYH